MQGRNTMWILGTDHAGIATQSVVEKELAKEGTSRHGARPRGVRSSGSGNGASSTARTIVEQYKRLGASCDYDRERFTLDEGYVQGGLPRLRGALREGLHLPRQLHGQLGSRARIGDLATSRSRTARSTDTLYEIDYPLEDGDGELTVATVRPGDDARRHRRRGQSGRRALPRRSSASTRSCRWSSGALPIIADEHVDPEFGTGALKITPGHDPNDFEIGRKHGLEEISVIGEDGRMTDEAAGAIRAG